MFILTLHLPPLFFLSELVSPIQAGEDTVKSISESAVGRRKPFQPAPGLAEQVGSYPVSSEGDCEVEKSSDSHSDSHCGDDYPLIDADP